MILKWQQYKKTFALFLLLIIVFSSCSDERKLYKIGILCGLDFFEKTVDGFKTQLADLGYVEGKNVEYVFFKSHSNIDSAKNFLHSQVQNKVDLIFVFPTDVAIAAKQIAGAPGIPVLFANANIEGTNLINSIRQPGINITGVRYPGPDLTVKRFEILKEIAPGIKNILVPYKKGLEIIPSQLEALYEVSKSSGINIFELPASNALDLKNYITDAGKEKTSNIDAILMIAEPFSVTPGTFTILCEFAYEHQLPIGGALYSVGEYSSIFGVSTDDFAVGKQAALLADKILKGQNAGDIPVVSAENFIQFNVEAAKKVNIKLPEGLLKQSNFVN